jgi:O-acetyl-ADP-ribose deacetylase (regulator of RNase III)
MIKISVERGDITEQQVDAIVNPANSHGWMGGGVAGAIKRKGGVEIEKEAVAKAPIPVGKAAITTAGKLKAKYVIHAPTMERPAEPIPIENVRLATRAALQCADKNMLRRISIPGMGTGVGGIPKGEGAKAMVEVVKKFRALSLEEVILIGFDDELVDEFKKALQ